MSKRFRGRLALALAAVLALSLMAPSNCLGNPTNPLDTKAVSTTCNGQKTVHHMQVKNNDKVAASVEITRKGQDPQHVGDKQKYVTSFDVAAGETHDFDVTVDADTELWTHYTLNKSPAKYTFLDDKPCKPVK